MLQHTKGTSCERMFLSCVCAPRSVFVDVHAAKNGLCPAGFCVCGRKTLRDYLERRAGWLSFLYPNRNGLYSFCGDFFEKSLLC